MKFTVQKSELMHMLTPAMGTVSNKNTITSIEGVLIETLDNGRIQISTYDMNKGFRATIETVSIEREGRFIINAQRLYQTVRVLPDDEITFDVNDKLNCEISCGKASFSMFALRGADFPNLPDLITDNGFDLPAICDDSTYLVIPADLSVYESSGYAIDSINYLSYKITGDDVLERIDYEHDSRSGMSSVGIDQYLMEEGYNELVLIPDQVMAGDRLFVYCNSPYGAAVRIENRDGMAERMFTGPFLTEIDTSSADIAIDISVTAEAERTCRVSLAVLDANVYESLKASSGEVSGSAFKVNINSINRAHGTNSLILPYAYDEGTRVRINGTAYDTYNICGKMAVTFDCGGEETVDVRVGKQSAGSLPAYMVSAFMALCLIAIPLIERYNEKKKVTGEGNTTNA